MKALRFSTVMPSAPGFHHERGDAAAVALAPRHPGHHDQQVGDDPVGGPQLDPVQHVLPAVVGGDGGGAQPGRVGADVRLGEQERADLAARAPGQEPLLLIVGAEQLHRLRHADRLVRRQQRAHRRGGGSGDHQRPVVVQLREAEAAVFRGDLHAERAQSGQALDGFVRDAGFALDERAVDVRLGELEHPGAEFLAALAGLLGRPRVRVDEVKLEIAEEELLAEARLAPVLLPGLLGHLPGLALVNVCHRGLPRPACPVATQVTSRSYPTVTAR